MSHLSTKWRRRVKQLLACSALLIGVLGVRADDATKPVKVFILAGQSNMEGAGVIKADPNRNGGRGSLEFLVKDEATAAKFKHLRGKDGAWAVRDDVWIHYLDRKGKLTAGFGAKEPASGGSAPPTWVEARRLRPVGSVPHPEGRSTGSLATDHDEHVAL